MSANAGRTLVTAGPSVRAEAVGRVHPEAEVVAPIRFGDTYDYGLHRGDTLVVVDGLFWQTASVRHRELLDLIDQGVHVYGSSSMGALRAAELTDYGMVGYGKVFDAYRDGVVTGDDEVGMVHGLPEDEYVVGVDALVNVRATLARARGRILDPAACDAVLEHAATRCFTDRSWAGLLRAADLPATDVRRMLAWVLTHPVDIKRDDALGLLRRLGAGQPADEVAALSRNATTTRRAPGASGFSSSWAWYRAAALAGRPGGASGGDVMELVAIQDVDHPVWRHDRLRRVLAAEELTGTPAGGPRGHRMVRPRRPTEPSLHDAVDPRLGLAQAWRARERALEGVDDVALDALVVARLRGAGALGDEDRLPDDVEQPWLSQAERSLPDQTRTAMVATRSIAVDRNSELPRTLLVDLARQGRLEQLADDVRRVRADFEARYPSYTGALSAAGTAYVEGLLAAHWGGPVDTELRRRGFRDLPELAVMFALTELC